MKDFDFIREFGKIKITDCCKSVKVDISNIYNKKTTLENAKKVREEIEDRIARLYLKGNKDVEFKCLKFTSTESTHWKRP